MKDIKNIKLNYWLFSGGCYVLVLTGMMVASIGNEGSCKVIAASTVIQAIIAVALLFVLGFFGGYFQERKAE